MDYRIKDEVGEVLAGLYASDTGSTWETTVEEALRKAFEAGRQSFRAELQAVADNIRATGE